MIFEVFGAYLSEFFIFLCEIFFGSKILPSSCDKDQKFDYGCSTYSENEARCPNFDRFLMILGIFKLSVWHKPLAWDTNFFNKELVQCL